MKVKWVGISGQEFVLEGVYVTLAPISSTPLLIEMTVNETERYFASSVEIDP